MVCLRSRVSDRPVVATIEQERFTGGTFYKSEEFIERNDRQRGE